jgi:hypothetical protein
VATGDKKEGNEEEKGGRVLACRALEERALLERFHIKFVYGCLFIRKEIGV